MSAWRIRLAHLDDEAAVRELSTHIWEGDDYVPETFHAWVTDPSGRFYLAFEGERLAGFGKLSYLAAGEWWLEGLRVHPDFRGRGVARLLHNYAVDLAQEIGTGMLRFATASTNKATHHMAASTGFTLVSPYLLAHAPALASASPAPFQAATPPEADSVVRWLAQKPIRKMTANLFEDGWQWFSLPPALPRLLAAGRVYWWRENAGIAIIDTTHDPDTPERAWMNLAVALGEEEMPALLADLRCLTAHLGRQTIHGKPPTLPLMRQWLNAAGWCLSEDLEMFVFARPLKSTTITQSMKS